MESKEQGEDQEGATGNSPSLCVFCRKPIAPGMICCLSCYTTGAKGWYRNRKYKKGPPYSRI